MHSHSQSCDDHWRMACTSSLTHTHTTHQHAHAHTRTLSHIHMHHTFFLSLDLFLILTRTCNSSLSWLDQQLHNYSSAIHSASSRYLSLVCAHESTFTQDLASALSLAWLVRMSDVFLCVCEGRGVTVTDGGPLNSALRSWPAP